MSCPESSEITASVLCRFRTASPYMQPGQLLPLWLIWALCWSKTQKCPQKMRSLFLSLFSLWSCLFGELQEKQQKIPLSCWMFTRTKRWWDLCRFALENSLLDKYLRHILSIYPAVIWALTGVFTKNYNTAKPTRNNVFNGEKDGVFYDHSLCILRVFQPMTDTFPPTPVALLGVSCTLLALRLVLVIWKNMKRPLLEDVSPEVMSPMEIAERQKKIYVWECWSFIKIWWVFFTTVKRFYCLCSSKLVFFIFLCLLLIMNVIVLGNFGQTAIKWWMLVSNLRIGDKKKNTVGWKSPKCVFIIKNP